MQQLPLILIMVFGGVCLVSKSGSKCATRHRFKRRHLSECFFMGFMRFEGKPDFSFGSFYL